MRTLLAAMSRGDWAAWLLMLVVTAALALLIAAYPERVRAHEAITGWPYPLRCCSDSDCAHAISAIRNPDGSLIVTTKHGTATFPADFKHEDSPDGLIHACFTPSRLYCLFLAVGI